MRIISIDRILELEFPQTSLLEGDEWKTELINEIYDPNKICVYNLTEEESFIIKKRFGVYDGGKIPSYEVIINEFNEKFNQDWNANYFFGYIKKSIIDKLMGHITTKECGKSTFIKDLPISPRAKRALLRDCGFKTLDEVLEVDKVILAKTLKNKKETYDEIIKYIDSLTPLQPQKKKEDKTTNLAISISDLDLNQRIICALYRQKIYTLKDLISHSIAEIKIMPGIGVNSLEKIVECVNCLGLSFCNDKVKNYPETEDCNDDITTRIKKMKIEQLTKLRNALLNVIAMEYTNPNDLNDKKLKK